MMIIAICVCIALVCFIIMLYSNIVIKTRVLIINNKKITKDISIVFVSDFHVGKHTKKKKLTKIINLINNVDADYLFIGGDMLGKDILKCYSNEELENTFNSFKIKNRYFVMGNHDDSNLSFYNNFKILNDNIVKLEDNLILVGLKWEKGECLDYKLDRKNYNILLSHYPDRVSEYSKIDLALGGHSHGKQVNLPLLQFHHKERYTRGLYKLENDTLLYVNRGLGFSLFKIRFLSTREIVKIELRKCDSDGDN